MTIKEALQNLDPKDDSQWTEEGLPAMEPLKKLTGNSQLSRKQVTESEPQFNRELAAYPGLSQETKEDSKVADDKDIPSTVTAETSEIDQNSKGAGDTASPTPATAAVTAEASIPDPNASGMDEKVAGQIDQVEAEIADLQICRDEADSQIHNLMREAESLRIRRIKITGPRERMLRQLEFIRKQGEIRAERHARTQKILKSIKASDIDPRSKLDRSFQRRTARGGKRPVVPVSLQNMTR